MTDQQERRLAHNLESSSMGCAVEFIGIMFGFTEHLVQRFQTKGIKTSHLRAGDHALNMPLKIFERVEQ